MLANDRRRRQFKRVLRRLLSALVMMMAASLLGQQSEPGDVASKPRGSLFPGPERIVYAVAPNVTDPDIRHFLAQHLVVFDRRTPRDAPLLVFMPGTSGQPRNAHFFLNAAADAGYRVIGLEYNDVPAAVQVCQRDRDRSCFARFREKRIYGKDVSRDIDDLPAESVVNRLTKLLQYLDAQRPDEGWGGYLVNGKPNWQRIAVSGHSQGAGMAAFLAKREQVYRVILFSSPWDYYGPTRELAPWVSSASATPPERWYGAYHQREHEAGMLKRAYAALRIPPDHVRVMTLEPSRQPAKANADAYHLSMIGGITPMGEDGRPAYTSEWAFMLGKL